MQERRTQFYEWLRLMAAVILARILLFGWAFVGYQIVIRPEFGVAGMLTRITGFSGELYGLAMIIVVGYGISGTMTRDKLLFAQITAWLHCGLTMIYSYFEVSGNLFALPFPTYLSICISLFILAMVVDD